MTHLPPYLLFTVSFLGALALSWLSIPRIIYIAKRKRLFDMPDNQRKIHLKIIPNLGGVAIFFGFIIVASLTVNPILFTKWNYIAAATLVLFVTGIKDDLINLPPLKKMVAQFAAAAITTLFADIRLTSLHGFMGIYELPYAVSIAFTTLGCMFVTNAFNLVDGIDGLAGSIGILCCFILGIFLGMEGNVSAACVAFSLMGAIAGFLRFNFSPAKIFMGDTGSLLIGFTISVLCILFINSYSGGNAIFSNIVHTPKSALLFSLAVLFIPIFDTFRVFTTRSIKGHSPFRADRTHLHHYLLDLGFSHTSAVSVLITSNLLIILVSYFVQDYNIVISFAALLFVAFGLFAIVFFMRRKQVIASSEPGGKMALANNTTKQPKVISTQPGAGIINGPITLNGSKVALEDTLEAM
ncbi:MraY family glycosyltransferase [Chitinophagaceae bacterium MMS25-I14]